MDENIWISLQCAKRHIQSAMMQERRRQTYTRHKRPLRSFFVDAKIGGSCDAMNEQLLYANSAYAKLLTKVKRKKVDIFLRNPGGLLLRPDVIRKNDSCPEGWAMTFGEGPKKEKVIASLWGWIDVRRMPWPGQTHVHMYLCVNDPLHRHLTRVKEACIS